MSGNGVAQAEVVVKSIADTAIENELYFGELDSVVGDGDFGYSLARGFERLLEAWDGLDRTSASAFLQGAAMILTSRIGGTSGPLWGTAMLRAALSVRGRDDLTGQDAVEMLRAAIGGIKQRGDAEVGDKTLLDALVPATDALEDALASGADRAEALRVLATTARTAAEATSNLQARRGRASYTGERSIGSPDAGAVAVAVILEHLAEADAGHP
jgi:dihydroxyacetone kinase phosphoprotein-dependent L subunit